MSYPNLRLNDYHPLAYVVKTRNLGTFKDKVKIFLKMPYPADPIVEPEYVGMTYEEVALLRQVQAAALGVKDSFEFLLDRYIGKPQTTNINLNATATYQEFLDGIAKVVEEEGDVIDITHRGSEEIS